LPERPPRLAEWTLGLLLNPKHRETLLGDFTEEYSRRASQVGVSNAKRWYWMETIKSSPALFHLLAMNFNRSEVMQKLSSLTRQNHKMAGLGLLLIIPALILCSGGLALSLLGMNAFSNAINFDLFIFNPLVLLGGLFLAFVLNLLTVAQVKIQDGSLTGTIRLRGKELNLGLLTCIGLLLSVIFLYLLAENFQIFAR